jgi:tetratricopeptide (TPR) repeat protein
MLPMIAFIFTFPLTMRGQCADKKPPLSDKEMHESVESKEKFESKSAASEKQLVDEIKKLKQESARIQFENSALRAMIGGNYAQSVGDFTSAIEKGEANPETFALYADRGAANMMLNSNEAAYKDYSDAINKTEAFIKSQEGQRNTTTGKPLDFSWANNLLANYYNERGVASLRLGHDKEAVADCDKALSLRPKRAKTLRDKSRALLHLKEYAEAAKAFDAANSIDPKLKLQGDAAFCKSLASNGQHAVSCN